MFLTKRIKEKRLAAGLTQSELGNLLGVSKVTVCHWEKGDKVPSANHLINLSKILNVSIDYLLGSDAYVVSSSDKKYGLMMADEEINIIRELRKHEKLYNMLINDNPKRTFDRIEKNLF